jgi:hypothetical protein
MASYEQDETLGNVLRLRIGHVGGESGNPELLISESHWDGEIRNGREYDCDVCFLPSAWPPT